MHESNPYQFERHYREMMSRAKRRLERILDRFGESIYDWLNAALNWPEEDWQADLANFVAHSRMTGIELSEESLEQIRGLVEARVNGTGVFATRERTSSVRTQVLVQLAAKDIKEQSTDAEVDIRSEPESTMIDGVEVAGPGPDVSVTYKDKVKKALEMLDPVVATRWHSPSVEGLIQSRNAWGPRRNVISYVENDRPTIVVDQSFTTGQTAKAIIEQSASGFFADSIATHKKRFGSSGNLEEFLDWREKAFKEAAAYASTLAEIYYSSLASITPAGELIATVADIHEKGVSWQHLLSALPLIDHLPTRISSVRMKLKGGREVVVDTNLLTELKKLDPGDVDLVASAVRASKTPEEAVGKIKQAVSGLRAKKATPSPTIPRRDVDVYRSRNPVGEVNYVGISSQRARRAADHLRTKGIRIEGLMVRLTREDARCVEQALIEIHGLIKNGGTLTNKINSIAKTHRDYAQRVQRGRDLLKSIGYTDDLIKKKS